MNSLSRLLLLAVSGLLLDVQAAPRGSPLRMRRLGRKDKTPAPTSHPTQKKHLYPSVDNLDNRVDAATEGEGDSDASPAPSSLSFQAEWGSQPQPYPTSFDKNTPWIDIDGNDEDDTGVEGIEPTPGDVVAPPPPTPLYVAPPTPTPVYYAPPPPAPVDYAPPPAPVDYAPPPPTPGDMTWPTPAYVYPPPPTPADAYPPDMALPTPVDPAWPVAAAYPWPTNPWPVAASDPWPTSVVNFQTMTPTVMPSSAPAIATYAPVALIPVNFGFIEKLPTLSFTTQPSGVPSTFPSSGSPSAAPTPSTAMPTEDDTLWTPLKTFDIQLTRDKRWNTQFVPEELRDGLEEYLVDSFMILSADLKNVTLNIFTAAYNEDKSEAWFRFQGKLFYEPKDNARDISPDEVWSQQTDLLKNMDAIQWILENKPAMAAGFVKAKRLTFLDGSTTVNFEGYSGASSSGLNQMTKIIIAVAAILLILACSVGVYIFLFLDPESDEPLPMIQKNFSGKTESDLSVGKELNSEDRVPDVTIEQEDYCSEVSSITELRVDEVTADPQIPGPSSVDAIASNDSRLASVSTPDMESLQLSSVDPDWSITASNMDAPVKKNGLLPPEDNHSADDGSVEDLYVK